MIEIFIGVAYNEEIDDLKAIIADNGYLKNINLGKWIAKTRDIGGFVYYE